MFIFKLQPMVVAIMEQLILFKNNTPYHANNKIKLTQAS